MLISVVMPVYNADKFLDESISSILQQTIADFELIIIDDGSTDGSLNIINKYASVDSRIKTISRPNMGLIYTLNQAISSARGDWIARMDADDISYPRRFEIQLARIAETGAEICGGSADLFGDITRRRWVHPITDSGIKLSLCFSSPFVHSSVLFSSRIAKIFQYSSTAEYSEDYDLWTRIALSGTKMTNTSESIIKYRLHSEQITNAKASHVRAASNAVQRNYLLALGFDSHSLEVFTKFSSSNTLVSINDAQDLMELLLNISYVDATDKLFVITPHLRRLSPPGLVIYKLYREFLKKLGLKGYFNPTLLFQSLFNIKYNSCFYKFIKRFVA